MAASDDFITLKEAPGMLKAKTETLLMGREYLRSGIFYGDSRFVCTACLVLSPLASGEDWFLRNHQSGDRVVVDGSLPVQYCCSIG